jgi:hypothetical protein
MCQCTSISYEKGELVRFGNRQLGTLVLVGALTLSAPTFTGCEAVARPASPVAAEMQAPYLVPWLRINIETAGVSKYKITFVDPKTGVGKVAWARRPERVADKMLKLRDEGADPNKVGIQPMNKRGRPIGPVYTRQADGGPVA